MRRRSLPSHSERLTGIIRQSGTQVDRPSAMGKAIIDAEDRRMRRTTILPITLAVGIFLISAFRPAQTSTPEVLVLEARGPLTPAMAEYLDRGLARAERLPAKLVVLKLDTPGGAIDLMNRMVQS